MNITIPDFSFRLNINQYSHTSLPFYILIENESRLKFCAISVPLISLEIMGFARNLDLRLLKNLTNFGNGSTRCHYSKLLIFGEIQHFENISPDTQKPGRILEILPGGHRMPEFQLLVSIER